MAAAKNSNRDGSSAKSVQDRLLDAAEELFCERGFDDTGVRDIAAAAGCNIASVNYYFRGKDNLYLEVWRRRLVLMRQTRLASIDEIMSREDPPPRLEDLLRSYAYAFVQPMANENMGRQFIKLMAREMIDPHLSENVLYEELIKPTVPALHKALVKTCPGLDESKTLLMILSIVGQLMHALHTKGFFEQTHGHGKKLFEYSLTDAVEHIVKFSAAGIRAYTKEQDK
ncbi:MAG: CerR family C-terminal domain-containing protein [Phycisphaerales bacterium]|nr:MAG: CerR family C-terminal domain-containing protein [Phycisphaerales bacterium]